jgi:hypothetical protein
MGIFPASNHVLLWGKAPDTTPNVFWLSRSRGVRGRIESSLHAIGLLSLARHRWVKLSSEDLRAYAPPGHIRLRFDRVPIRVGNFIIEMLG